MSVKPITNSLPISYEGEGLPLLKQIAQDTHIAAQAAQRQLLFSKIRLGLTAFLTALMLFAFLLWGPKLHRALQNADRAFERVWRQFPHSWPRRIFPLCSPVWISWPPKEEAA